MNSTSEERDPVKDILAWKSEPVLKLANHFHKFCDNAMQQKRVFKFEMPNKFVEEFASFGSITSINICLAINSNANDDAFSFYPILEIESVPSIGKSYLPLDPLERQDLHTLSDFVPRIFKDMILDNWNKLDIAYIDDLFIAQARDDEDNPTDQMVRVHLFEIGTNMIDFINQLNFMVSNDGGEEYPNITGITVYPGVDMNKFGNKKLISFTPVLGLSHLSDSPDTFSRNSLIEVVNNETFIEYTFPCPPTCKPKKD